MEQKISDMAAIDQLFNALQAVTVRLEQDEWDYQNAFLGPALAAVDCARRLLLAARNFEAAKERRARGGV